MQIGIMPCGMRPERNRIPMYDFAMQSISKTLKAAVQWLVCHSSTIRQAVLSGGEKPLGPGKCPPLR